ncbi:PIR Superfamily Protein [Plasmodium ovale wallikeri]|uniref:PIR Superfamily Protein n=1 Tax=Plasmodium ovale wallikeri TaxID=864142 RepID=A0A1A9AMJ9_PLAOA|nr:PIR Superfamily Protein [Plasmodium ovale wallikeri]SBT57308.1 PIR Superfamily Protein [Plasmodium ovale wallikeri]
MENDENIISLPSNLNYWQFNNKNYDTLYGHYVECDEFQKDLDKDDVAIKNFCLKLTGILDQFDKLSVIELFDGDRCSIVIYWMYDTLFQDIINKNIYADTFRVVHDIWNLWLKIEKTKKCTSMQPALAVYDTFKKSKMLYYYALDFDSIQAKSKVLNFKCTQQYSDYINAYVQTYNTIKSDCESEEEKDKEYCTLLERIHRIKDKDDLSDLKACTPVANEVRKGETAMEDPGELEEAEVESSYAQSSSEDKVGVSVAFPLLGVLFISSIFYKFTPFGPWIRSHVLKNANERYDVGEEETENILENPYEFSNMNSNSNGHNIGYQSLEDF